jgi:transposase
MTTTLCDESRIQLTADERRKLELMASRPKSTQRAAQRARIVLRCAEAAERLVREVARDVGAHRTTVRKWRDRFARDRLDGLLDEPRVGAPRRVTDDRVEKVVTKTLETVPKGATHWSRRSMAAAVGLSADTIGRIWHAFGLKPHRVNTFKLSPDPQFVEKVRDIVGLYMSPPERAVVFCVDEKSQMQALDRTQPLLPMDIGQPERRTHDYVRHGTSALFAALNVKTGDVIHECHRRHRQQEFLKFLERIDECAPPIEDIHLVLDNLATHKTPRVQRWLVRHPRFHLHFIPTYSSWLNLVERLFAEVTDKAIRRGTFRSVAELERAVRAYLDTRNEDPKPFVWTAGADLILDRVRRCAERVTAVAAGCAAA